MLARTRCEPRVDSGGRTINVPAEVTSSGKRVVLINMARPDEVGEVFNSRADLECKVVAEQTEHALLRHIGGVHGLLLGLAPLTERVIAAAAQLRVVSRRGVGYDNVDLPALTRAGIPLAVVGTANSVSVAEHTLHLMLALAKQSHVHDARLRHATWDEARLVRPVDLAGRRVLILGLGRIGRLLLKRLNAMEMEVLVHDPFVADGEITAAGGRAVADWRAALPQIDFLTVNCPKTPETTGMVGTAELAALKPTAFVINTARGGIVDEAALYAALRARSIGGAGIDAFEQEPASTDNPLFALDNAIFTPHVAGLTDEAVYRMNVRAAQNVVDGCAGTLDPQFVVNREVLTVRA